MRITSYILTALLLFPITGYIYVEYVYMTDKVMSKGLVFIDEMQILVYLIGYSLLLGYAIFLTLRKKYVENVVFISAVILFIAIQMCISNYTKKERIRIGRQLFEHNN